MNYLALTGFFRCFQGCQPAVHLGSLDVEPQDKAQDGDAGDGGGDD